MLLVHVPFSERGEGLPHTIPYYLADHIKTGIIHWRYPPDASLREVELAAEFGASRGPVREALRILELQGLVVHTPRRGFKVKAHTADDLRHLYRLRAQLEGEVIDALAAKDVGQLADALDRANKVMRNYAKCGDIEKYFVANVDFHQQMIDSTESSVLWMIMRQVNAMSLPVRFAVLSAEFSNRTEYAYHDQISRALRARNFKFARKLTIEHITANLIRAVDVYAAALRKYTR